MKIFNQIIIFCKDISIFGQPLTPCSFYYVSPIANSSGTGTKDVNNNLIHFIFWKFLKLFQNPMDFLSALNLANSNFISIRMLAGDYYFQNSISIPSNLLIEGQYIINNQTQEWMKTTNANTVLHIQPPLQTKLVNNVLVGHYIGFL